MYAKGKKYVYCSDILERLIEIVKFLDTLKLAFRGSSGTLCQEDNEINWWIICKAWPIYEKSYPKSVIWKKFCSLSL